MKQTKWAGYKFNADQKKARAKWRQAQETQFAICDAFKMYPGNYSREELHAKLDKRLDIIEKQRASAKELFPEVDESFTVAQMTVTL